MWISILLTFLSINQYSHGQDVFGSASSLFSRLYKGFQRLFEFEEHEVFLGSVSDPNVNEKSSKYQEKDKLVPNQNKILAEYQRDRFFFKNRYRKKVKRQFIAAAGNAGAVLPVIAVGAAAVAVINSDQDGLAQPIELVATTTYNVLNPIASLLGIPLYNPYAEKTEEDKCSTVTTCVVTNEVCVNGACGCGGGSTCQYNVLAPLCNGASCSECTSSSQCPSSTPSCVQNRCIVCHQDSDCGQDGYCGSGVCYVNSMNSFCDGAGIDTVDTVSSSLDQAVSECNNNIECVCFCTCLFGYCKYKGTNCQTDNCTPLTHPTYQTWVKQ